MNERAQVGEALAVQLTLESGSDRVVSEVLERLFRLRPSDHAHDAIPGDKILPFQGTISFELAGMVRRDICLELVSVIERYADAEVHALDARFGAAEERVRSAAPTERASGAQHSSSAHV